MFKNVFHCCNSLALVFFICNSGGPPCQAESSGHYDLIFRDDTLPETGGKIPESSLLRSKFNAIDSLGLRQAKSKSLAHQLVNTYLPDRISYNKDRTGYGRLDDNYLQQPHEFRNHLGDFDTSLKPSSYQVSHQDHHEEYPDYGYGHPKVLSHFQPTTSYNTGAVAVDHHHNSYTTPKPRNPYIEPYHGSSTPIHPYHHHVVPTIGYSHHGSSTPSYKYPPKKTVHHLEHIPHKVTKIEKVPVALKGEGHHHQHYVPTNSYDPHHHADPASYNTHASFDCVKQHAYGRRYFADVQYGCKTYHFCHEDGRQETFQCSAGTLFDEVSGTCDHAHAVYCHSETGYEISDKVNHGYEESQHQADHTYHQEPSYHHHQRQHDSFKVPNTYVTHFTPSVGHYFA